MLRRGYAFRNACVPCARRHMVACACSVRVAKCAAPQQRNGVFPAFPSSCARAVAWACGWFRIP
eukprot:9142061-Lingulodinium_polyedra.AAC.1